MNPRRYIDNAIFEGQQRIEAGYCDYAVVLRGGGKIYPVNAAGCAMLARWCLKMAEKPYNNKYDCWRWQMNAAKWYRLAAGGES